MMQRELPPRVWAFGIIFLLVSGLVISSSAQDDATDALAGATETTVEMHPQEAAEHVGFEPQEWLKQKMQGAHWAILLGVIAVAVLALGKGADLLVDEAVELSLRSGIPKVVVGATVVSMGTTTPEAVVSVLAAIQGEPGLALGNAVGSIICDTGLILGAACLISPLAIDRKLVNRQGWIQFGCGVLLVVASVAGSSKGAGWTGIFEQGGNLPQTGGFLFLILLAVYMIWSIKMAKTSSGTASSEEGIEVSNQSLAIVLLRLFAAIAVVVVASSFLISAATELAEQWNVPESLIAATLVAFGTSFPELVICVGAARKQQGELAVGNIIGADILNVLFVAGAAAAVTPAGLDSDAHFFKLQFPAMLFVLIVFRAGIFFNRTGKLSRSFGLVLVAAYLAVTIFSYFGKG